MATLSLGMIVKNEAANIERILTCAKGFCDELVVADTGSTDDTVAIAERLGAKVVHFEWIDNFAAARNFAFEHCTGDWLIWLDADDIVPEADQAKLRGLKNEIPDDIDTVFCTYQIAFNAQDACTFSFPRERVIRRSAGLRWECPVHECMSIDFARMMNRLDINIQHRPDAGAREGHSDRNLKILEKAVAEGDRSTRTLYYLGNELRDGMRYADAIPVYEEYLKLQAADWEQHAAMLSLARCYGNCNQPDEALAWGLKAIGRDSKRAEGFNYCGIHFYNRGEWAKAIPFFTASTALTRPDTGFINDDDYGWIPYDYLSICYDRLGQYETSIQMTLKALPTNPDKARLIKNMHWLSDQL